MKKFLAMLLTMVMVLSLAACGAKEEAPATTPNAPAEQPADTTDTAGASFVLKLGHACSAAHPYNQGAQLFKETVEAKTEGKVVVELYPESQLGAERDMIEGLQMGTLEMCLVSTAPLSSYTSEFLAFDLPYLFESKDQARAACDGEVAQEMLDSLSANGLHGLCYFENGFRHFTNNDHVIDDPSDLKGMKIRVMENPIMMDSITALGGAPTPMAFNELYTALQQNTIDGQENPVSQIYDKKFYEVQKYMTISNHFYAPAPFLVSEAVWSSLPAEYQTIIQAAAYEARDYMRERNDAEEEAQLQEMVDKHGVNVCADFDIQAFKDAVQPVYDEYVGEGKQIAPSLVEALQNAG